MAPQWHFPSTCMVGSFGMMRRWYRAAHRSQEAKALGLTVALLLLGRAD
jgi:hypothetical protein